MQAKVGSKLKSVQQDHESLKKLINEIIFGDQIALQINFSVLIKILTFVLHVGIKDV